jgi:hypothetical protein
MTVSLTPQTLPHKRARENDVSFHDIPNNESR